MKTNTTNLLRKITMVTALVMVSSFSVFSQAGKFNAGVELAFPVGTNFSNFASVGFGVSGKYEAPFTGAKNLNWNAGLGFLDFASKNNTSGSSTSITMIPLIGGVKYYVNEANTGFYVGADIGIDFVTAHVKTTVNGTTYRESSGDSRFIFAPGAGYVYGNFDFSARFNVISDFSYFNLRAAYIFNK